MHNSEAKTTSNTQLTRTCYLAAPINTDLKELEKLLVERQIRPIVSADISSVATTFLGGTVDAISTADLFIAILSSEQSNDNVYVELGIAIAKERRILIIAPSNGPLMVNIAELPIVRATITNYDDISLMLDQVLMAPLRKFKPPLPIPTVQVGQPIGDFADELEEKLVALGIQVRETEIIQLIRLALEKSGYTIIANNPLIGHGKNVGHPDLIVWSDEFGPWIGTPLIIEVKSSFRKQINWSEAAQQVLEYLQLSQTRSGLVLYTSTQTFPNNIVSQFPPNIFFLSVHQLFTAMRTKSFAEIMVDLRNRRVHGIDNV